ncbi:MAG: 16S rRNA (cytidine(1402)-2'-O)-methyltransferase [Hyphomicrobiaceae bacterium]
MSHRSEPERESRSATGGTNAAAPSPLVSRVAAELDRWLAEPLVGGLYLVATPIGNLGDMTLRALAVLARADVVYCEDTRHSRTLLAHFAIDRSLRAYHEHNADAERPRVLAELAQGRAIALISDAGMPLVSDPGFKLVRDCVAKGHQVTCIPGASSVISAVAVSGLPTDRFHFTGFLPSREGQRMARLAELGAIPATLVLFEAPNRLAAALADIAEVLGADREVVVARELTKRFEEVRRGSAVELAAWAAAEPPRGEIVILVGPPAQREATDEDIEAALSDLLPAVSVKDAAKTVAGLLRVSRSRAYEIGLRLKGKAP